MIATALLLAAAITVSPSATRSRLGLPVRRIHGRTVIRVCVIPAVGVALCLLPWSTMAAVGILAGTIVGRRRRTAQRARRRAESLALRDGLDVLVGELRVGAHPVAAFDTAASEVDGPVAVALHGVAARGRLGADVAAGLGAAGASSVLPAHWDRLAVCWRLAQDHGLAIASLLSAAQRDIIERERFSIRVDAGLAGARTTALLLAALPVLGVALGEMIGAGSVRFLLSGGTGGWFLIAGVLLAGAGLWWSDRIAATV